MGIPCGRTIRGLMGLDSKVSAAHFDVYWLYNRPVLAPDPLVDVPAQFGMIELTNIDPLLPDPADIPLPPPAVLLPLKVRAKGRSRKDDTSTKYQPSAWERNGGPRSSGARNTPRSSHPNDSAAASSSSTTISSIQFTSTAISTTSTVIPSTQYPSSSTITVNLTASEAITTQNNDGFIPTEELEAAQVAQATEPKKRGRPVGSKDKQPCKKRAKNAAVEEESEWNTA